MNKLARGVAAGVAIGAITLTGCSRPPSAAAVVEGHRIPDSKAQEVGTVLASSGLVDPANAGAMATLFLAIGEASSIIADENGMEITDADLDALIAQDQSLTAVAGSDPGLDWARSYALVNTVANARQEQFTTDLQQLDIEINPRYGTWDPEAGQLVSSSLAIDAEA